MRLYLIALLTFACSLFDTMRDNGARAISEEHFKKVHGIQSAEVGIEEWTHDVSLRLFEIREKYGSPLSNMEKNEKRILPEEGYYSVPQRQGGKGKDKSGERDATQACQEFL